MSLFDDGEWHELYSAAEALVKTNWDLFDGSMRHEAVKEALAAHYGDGLPKGRGVQAMPVAGERRQDNDEFVHYTGSDTILGPLIDGPDAPGPDRFRILPEHRVKALVTQGGRVEHAIVHDLIRGRELRIHADLFVVAAGSILTPQLLWASGIRDLHALGRYLTEHPLAFTQVVLSERIVDGLRADPRFAERVRSVEPDDPIPIPMHEAAPSLMIPVSEERPWHCQIQRDSFSYGDLPPDIDTRLVVDLRWFGMTDAEEANRVVFEDDLNDTFGMPKPTFEFRLSADDRERAHVMMADMLDAASALGGFLPGAEPRFMDPGLSLHFQGTYRMGERDDGTCVVDKNSRVFGFDNLYLGGNGLISTRTASNPTLTSIALAVRAASTIAGRPLARRSRHRDQA
jgi:pyranose oxidase